MCRFWVVFSSFFLFILFFLTPVAQAQTWSPAVNISNNPSTSTQPKIAEDSLGTLHTVWCDNAPGNGNVHMFYSNKLLEGAWSEPQDIVQSVSACPNTMVISQDDTIHVVYGEFSGGTVDLYYVSKTTSGSWSSPIDVAPGPNDAYNPSLVVGSDGVLYMAWWEAGGGYNAYWATKPVGGSWSSPSQIYGSAGAMSSLAIDSSDTLHFVWQVGARNVFYLTKPVNGSWSSPTQLTDCPDDTSLDCVFPVIAARGDTVHLIWHKTSNWPTDRDIYYQSKTGSGSWNTAVNITADVGDDSYVENGGLSVDSLGKAHVAWWNVTSGVQDVYYSQINGSEWTTPLNLSDSSVNSNFPALIVDSADYEHLVWLEALFDGVNFNGEIYYRNNVPTNQPPTVDANGPYQANEGGSVQVSATGQDPENGTLTYAWDLDNNGSYETPGQTVNYSASNLDGPDIRTISVQVMDDGNLTAVASTTVTVVNVAPTILTITGPTAPVVLGNQIDMYATFTDSAPADTHTATWNWMDGTTSSGDVDDLLGTVTGSHTYTSVGVYTVSLTVADDDNGVSEPKEYSYYVVVYNPTGGFMTGAGRFDMPAGSIANSPTEFGMTNFGTNAKYVNGVLTGTTRLNFRDGQFTFGFDSTSYDWLVVNGTQATLHGSGEVDGVGGYTFELTANDNSPDTFRLQIWDGNTLVYDNGTSNLANGNIEVHN